MVCCSRLMKRIAIYGKGGIGKTTTVSNLATILAKQGNVILQVGCDPKGDSTILHTHGKRINTILNAYIEKGENLEISDFLVEADDGVLCIEAGGPTPGTGCAGRGIITAFEKIKELKVFEKYKPDYVLYDVLGDVVCGGFAMPIKNGYADELYVVTSGEMMSLYAADNVIEAVRINKNPSIAKFKGVILNKKNIENEDETVLKFCKEKNAELIQIIERSPYIQEAEKYNNTVVEQFPEADITKRYIELAQKIGGENEQ